MNKNEFLKILSASLKGIPQDDKKEIIADYEEHFIIGLKEGRKEEDICELLGNPRSIAKQYKIDSILKEAEKSLSVSRIMNAIIASLSLGFFNIVFILGPYIGLLAILIALFASAFAITVTGLFLFFISLVQPLFSSIIYFGINPVIAIFLAIGTTSLGLLFLIGDCFLAKYFYIGTIKYLKFNLKIIKKWKEIIWIRI